MPPIINSIKPDNLFETGGIIVSGLNFNSSDTRLLISGVECNILVITDAEIKATIPFLPEDDAYDVRVMINSRYSSAIYSKPFFVEIDKLDPDDIVGRGKPA